MIYNQEGTNSMVSITGVNHPANKGLDFAFNGGISKKVLCNYLSRSIIMEGITSFGGEMTDNYLRLIYHTGAKYIGRSLCSWGPHVEEENNFKNLMLTLKTAHEVDSDIIFEACIFECVTKMINEIIIPSWVFEAFEMKPETRCFNYDKMLLSDKKGLNLWGEDASVPDITKEETQLFFYYRSCAFISLGYEAIHMGQVHWIGMDDVNYIAWTKVLTMIREYARLNARRNFVLINAHTHGIIDANGKLMFDFHAWPVRGFLPEDSKNHISTEENPQKMELKIGQEDAIFTKSMGGITYSGWSCESLPYFVELDNCQSVYPDFKDNAINWWGYDEITWYANQPAYYRAEWLEYAYRWVNQTDRYGFFEMPGRRTAQILDGERVLRYYYSASNSQFSDDGMDDENTILNIWIADRESRKIYS